MCFDKATLDYYELTGEGFWPTNYRNNEGRIGWIAPDNGHFLTPIKSTGPYRRGWEACVGCGNETAKLMTGNYKCVLYRHNLKTITWPEYTETTRTASAAFCMAEFSLCSKCRTRAQLVMDTSDHLAAGSRWESLAEHLHNLMTLPDWEMTLDERIAKHDERDALLAKMYEERDAFAEQQDAVRTNPSRYEEEDW